MKYEKKNEEKRWNLLHVLNMKRKLREIQQFSVDILFLHFVNFFVTLI